MRIFLDKVALICNDYSCTISGAETRFFSPDITLNSQTARLNFISYALIVFFAVITPLLSLYSDEVLNQIKSLAHEIHSLYQKTVDPDNLAFPRMKSQIITQFTKLPYTVQFTALIALISAILFGTGSVFKLSVFILVGRLYVDYLILPIINGFDNSSALITITNKAIVPEVDFDSFRTDPTEENTEMDDPGDNNDDSFVGNSKEQYETSTSSTLGDIPILGKELVLYNRRANPTITEDLHDDPIDSKLQNQTTTSLEANNEVIQKIRFVELGPSKDSSESEQDGSYSVGNLKAHKSQLEKSCGQKQVTECSNSQIENNESEDGYLTDSPNKLCGGESSRYMGLDNLDCVTILTDEARDFDYDHSMYGRVLDSAINENVRPVLNTSFSEDSESNSTVLNEAGSSMSDSAPSKYISSEINKEINTGHPDTLQLIPKTGTTEDNHSTDTRQYKIHIEPTFSTSSHSDVIEDNSTYKSIQKIGSSFKIGARVSTTRSTSAKTIGEETNKCFEQDQCGKRIIPGIDGSFVKLAQQELHDVDTDFVAKKMEAKETEDSESIDSGSLSYLLNQPSSDDEDWTGYGKGSATNPRYQSEYQNNRLKHHKQNHIDRTSDTKDTELGRYASSEHQTPNIYGYKELTAEEISFLQSGVLIAPLEPAKKKKKSKKRLDNSRASKVKRY